MSNDLRINLNTTRRALRDYRQLGDTNTRVLKFYGGKKPREFILLPDVGKAIGVSQHTIRASLLKLQGMGAFTIPQSKKKFVFTQIAFTEHGEELLRIIDAAR